MFISEELMKWAAKKAGGTLSKVTLKVMQDFNVLDAVAFARKYSCTKTKYFARVLRYGDPYMRAPLAKLGKLLIKLGF